MWVSVLVLALWMATADPVRLIIATFLVSHEKPLRNLVAYWLGGAGGGIITSVVVIVFLRDIAAPVMHAFTSTVSNLTGGYVRIVLGLVALMLAARVGSRMLRRQVVGMPMDTVTTSSVALAPRPSAMEQFRSGLQRFTPPAITRFSARIWETLGSGSPKVSFAAGIMTAMPPVEHQAALTTIMAADESLGAQLGASIMFVLLVMAALEIVLVSYFLAPAKTQNFVLRLQSWMVSVSKKLFPLTAGAAGVMLILSGLGGI